MSENELSAAYIFVKSAFNQHLYDDRIFVDFNIQKHFGYEVDRRVFRFFYPLVEYLDDNPSMNIYFTEDFLVTNIQYYQNDILVNIDEFIHFCDNIGQSKKDKSRVKAYFGQHLSIKSINISEEDKNQYIQANLNEKHFLDSIKNISPDGQTKILNAIIALDVNCSSSQTVISEDNFIKIFSRFISEKRIQDSVLDCVPKIQLNVLKDLKVFVENNLENNETTFTNWIDEEKGKYRRQRCLIFGVDYVDPKREGEINRKRFDILATQDRENHILIELKSPTADIFETEIVQNHNEGQRTTYKLSKELSRAIPQILGYKRRYEGMDNEEVQSLGITSKRAISECIIVIGTRKEDAVWLENFKSLTDSLNIKIWTYTYLLEKMGNTIKNLEENLYL